MIMHVVFAHESVLCWLSLLQLCLNTDCQEVVVRSFSAVNIFIGIQLKKANVTKTAFYFLIVHEVLKCLMIVIFEVLLIKEKYIIKQEETYQLNCKLPTPDEFLYYNGIVWFL